MQNSNSTCQNITEPVKARKEARREVAEEEFFRSFRP